MRLVAVGLVAVALVGCGRPAPASSPTTPPTASAADRTTTSSAPSGEHSPPSVLTLRAQACDRPQPRNGVAVVMSPSLVATAAHLVEGDLRSLEVDGRKATVAALDLAADLAVLSVADLAASATASAPSISAPEVGPVHVLTADGVNESEIIEIVTLRVDNLSDDRIDERRSAKVDLDVQPGDSGSAVVDEQGALVGIVTLRRPASGVSYATTSELLTDLIDEVGDEASAGLDTPARRSDAESAGNGRLAPAEPCV